MSKQILNKAKARRDDEFFTQYKDVEQELSIFTTYFKDKVIYCNCDSEDSNFVKYFLNNKQLGYSKIIHSWINENGSKLISYDASKNYLKEEVNISNGSYDSVECIDALNSCDIVVTNPPFSKFIHYSNLLVASGKQFIIFGHNLATYKKNMFNYIINNLVFPCKQKSIWYINDGDLKQVKTIIFNNIIDTRTELLINDNINKSYDTYDNTDILKIDKIKDIPLHIKDKYIGVPIGIMEYKLDRFDVVASRYDFKYNNKEMFNRIVLKVK